MHLPWSHAQHQLAVISRQQDQKLIRIGKLDSVGLIVHYQVSAC